MLLLAHGGCCGGRRHQLGPLLVEQVHLLEQGGRIERVAVDGAQLLLLLLLEVKLKRVVYIVARLAESIQAVEVVVWVVCV